MELFKALKTRSKSYDAPFKHWEIDRPLTSEAIKEICNTEIADISKEVQMMRMCHHSNVLCCHASFVSKSELFLVTPLMEKGSCLRIMRVAKRQGRGEGLAEQWLGYVLFEILR